MKPIGNSGRKALRQAIEKLSTAKDGFDRIGKCNHRYSQDYFWEIQLRPNFWLEFIDDVYHQSLSILNDRDESMHSYQGVLQHGLP